MARLSFSSRFFVVATLSLLSLPIVYAASFNRESWSGIFSSAVVLVASVVLARGNPIDPRVWFPVFGGLYSFSFYTPSSWGRSR